MSNDPNQTKLVDVAVGVVVDNMSPINQPDQSPSEPPSASASSKSLPRILITRRKADQVLGGYWELPGGKIEPGETPRDAVARELFEETGIEVAPIDTLDTVDYRYDHAHVRLIPFICEHISGTPQALEVDEVRWVTPDTLGDYQFPEASLPVLHALKHWLQQREPNRSDPAAPAPA